MKTMLLYRVEHKESRIGPYNNYFKGMTPAYTRFRRNHCYHSRIHPNPNDDSPSVSMWDIKNEYGCKDSFSAFASLSQYQRWFSKPEQKILDREGYHLVAVKVNISRIRVLAKQAVFAANRRPKIIERMSCVL